MTMDIGQLRGIRGDEGFLRTNSKNETTTYGTNWLSRMVGWNKTTSDQNTAIRKDFVAALRKEYGGTPEGKKFVDDLELKIGTLDTRPLSVIAVKMAIREGDLIKTRAQDAQVMQEGTVHSQNKVMVDGYAPDPNNLTAHSGTNTARTTELFAEALTGSVFERRLGEINSHLPRGEKIGTDELMKSILPEVRDALLARSEGGKHQLTKEECEQVIRDTAKRALDQRAGMVFNVVQTGMNPDLPDEQRLNMDECAYMCRGLLLGSPSDKIALRGTLLSLMVPFNPVQIDLPKVGTGFDVSLKHSAFGSQAQVNTAIDNLIRDNGRIDFALADNNTGDQVYKPFLGVFRDVGFYVNGNMAGRDVSGIVSNYSGTPSGAGVMNFMQGLTRTEGQVKFFEQHKGSLNVAFQAFAKENPGENNRNLNRDFGAIHATPGQFAAGRLALGSRDLLDDILSNKPDIVKQRGRELLGVTQQMMKDVEGDLQVMQDPKFLARLSLEEREFVSQYVDTSRQLLTAMRDPEGPFQQFVALCAKATSDPAGLITQISGHMGTAREEAMTGALKSGLDSIMSQGVPIPDEALNQFATVVFRVSKAMGPDEAVRLLQEQIEPLRADPIQAQKLQLIIDEMGTKEIAQVQYKNEAMPVLQRLVVGEPE